MSLTAEQKAMRLGGIGSSEIAALAGLDPYKTPMAVYLEKKGIVEVEETEAMRRGNWLEGVIADWFAAEYDVKLERGTTTRAKAHDWMLATPDFVIVDKGALLECKTAGLRQVARWGDADTDEVPEAYLAQVQWQMAVTGYREVSVAVLLATENFPRVFTVKADDELQDGLAAIAGRFWRDHILADQPPPPDASEATRAWLRAKYPKHISTVRQATQWEADRALAFVDAKREREKWEEEEATIRAELCAKIGDAEGIEGEFGRITWKAAKDGAKTDWEALARAEFTGTQEQWAFLLGKFTTTTPGSRRFLVKPAAAKEQ